MLRFSLSRCLASSFALLCLLALSRTCWAQDTPTPAVKKLVDQGKAAYEAGKHDEALRLYNEALTQARQGKDAVGEALTLKNIGNVYFDIDQPQKALEFYTQALPIAHAAGDKLVEAYTLYNIGNLYLSTGQPQKGLEAYEKALPLYRQAGDKNGEANALHNIGNVYSFTDQPQKALDFYEQALRLFIETANKSWEAATLNSISIVYLHTGQPQKGLEIFKKALPLYRQAGDKNGEANVLNNTGIAYLSTGQPQKALEFCEQALSLHRQAGNKNGEAFTLNDIGIVYLSTGQPQKGLEAYEKALPLYRQAGDKNGEANTLFNISRIYQNNGQPQKALKFYEQTLALYRQTRDKHGEAATLNDIGMVYLHTEQPQKALDYCKQSLLLYKKIEYKNEEAFTLINIGRVYSETGQAQTALEFYERALLLHRQTGEKSGEANTLFNISRIYQNNGQPQKALKFYEQTLALYRQTRDKHGEAKTLDAMASSEHNLSHPDKALLNAQQAVVLLEKLRSNVGSQGEGRSAFLASNLYIYYHCLNLLRQQGHIAEALALTQKTKARSLLDLLASSRVDLTAALTSEEKQQLQTLQGQAESLNQQMLKEGVENEVGAKKRFAALQTQLKQNESQLQLLMDRLYALHPQMADQQQAHTATVADVARLLPADAALLEYAQTSNTTLLLFVVTTRDGKPQVRLYPIAVANALLHKQCAAFHNACADPRKDPLALSVSLSRLLLSPASKLLAGKKRLIVCPDGPLWDVAFAALRTPSSNKIGRHTSAYLWQQYELSYAYSATGMQAAARAHNRHKPAEQATALVLANPDFGTSKRFGDIDNLPGQRPFEMPSRPFEIPSRPFEMPSRPLEMPSRPFELPSRQMTQALERGKEIKSLPGAQKEADAIHKLFPDAAIYTGKAAQESVVMTEAGKYKYLHFATHGFFNDAAPLLSCIVLAQPEVTGTVGNDKAQGTGQNNALTIAAVPANTEAAANPDATPVAPQVNDGLLTARKVFGLHLNADLVTLSACNSGRGQVRTGEGIVGLTWAFFAAGCPSQVVSQWSVDDAATGQLMADFYKGLKAGKSKSAALRSAALKLSKDGKHSHPYYWTPFFLVGDWK